MTRRRIAYYTSSYPALTETFVAREIQYLRQRGWDVNVFAFARAGDIPPSTARAQEAQRTQYGRNAGILSGLLLQFLFLARNPAGYGRCLTLIAKQFYHHPIPIALKQVGYFLAAVTFSRELERQQIPHIHAHFATASTMALFTHYLTNRPFSMAAHASADIYTNPIMLDEKLRHATMVVAESEYNRSFLNLVTNNKYATKIEVVYNGVSVGPMKPRPADNTEVHILSVAGLRVIKGFPTLLAALALVRDAGYAFRCTIVGDGPMRDMLRRQIKQLDLEEHVRMLGALENQPTVEQMRSADLFVLASEVALNGLRDGLPTVCTEAMGSGVPVISTYVSGIPELVLHERTGLLAPEKRPDLLAEAIIRLIQDPTTRNRLSLAGYAHVLCNFDARNTLFRLEQLLERALQHDL
jgi:glycosyltransferase involved in cell wall biosynthesis